MKNPSTSPQHSPESSKDDEDEKNKELEYDVVEEKNVESSSKSCFESENDVEEEVDVNSIDRKDLPLAITPTLVTTIEWWGYLSMPDTYNDKLGRLPNARIKRNLYLDKRLTTTGMSKLPRFEARFSQCGL